MKKHIPYFMLLLLIMTCMLTVTGCQTVQNKDFFDGVEEQVHSQMESVAVTNNDTKMESKQKNTQAAFRMGNLPEYWFNFGIYAKRWAAVIMVSSLACGWIVYDIFKRNKEVQKWAFDVLIIRIPVFTFLIIYVYAFLYRMLNL